MSYLSQALQSLKARDKGFSGRLSVDGRLSTVRMQYESQAVMVVRGLPSGLPPYLQFNEWGIKLSPNGDYEGHKVAEVLNVYRVLDPRTVSVYLIDQEGTQIEPTTRWVTAFSPQNMSKDFRVTDTLVQWMQGQKRQGKSLWESEEVYFAVEGGRIVEMSIPDLPPLGPHLTIEFLYSGVSL